MKKFFKSILNFFNIYAKTINENHNLRVMIIEINKEKERYRDQYYTNYGRCTTCESKTRDNDRFQKEVIVLKQLIEEKNLVIDKLTSVEYSLSKTKDLNNGT